MPIEYNVATLLREPIGASRAYEVKGAVLIDEDQPRSEHVAGHTSFLRTKDGLLVTAALSGVDHQQCSRCLREIDIPMQLAVEEEFIATVDANTGAALAPPEDPEAFRIDAHHMLDIEEAVRQSWALALPMQPLCRPDCRGLCPQCGQDRNEKACLCAPEGDQRWSALQELALELEGK